MPLPSLPDAGIWARTRNRPARGCRTYFPMGVAPDLAKGAVRVSLGRENTAAQVQEFLAALGATLQRLTHLAAIAV